jgi:integrase
LLQALRELLALRLDLVAEHLLDPLEFEAIRAAMEQADATLVSVLAYAGLRPGEALALKWGDIRDNTIHVSRALSFGEEKATKTGNSRAVHMIPALRWDLAAWRLVSGRPPAGAYLLPGPDGGAWDEGRYRRWRRFKFKPALALAGIDSDVRVYDLRHHRRGRRHRHPRTDQ